MHQINDPRIVRAWTFYDWANSVYSLVIVSSVFPVYYQAVTTAADGTDQVNFFGFTLTNSVLLSYAISFSFILVTPILPILSGIADYTGKKKGFMKVFVWIGGLACCGLYFFTGEFLEWGIICLILASIGYSGSVVFYDAFLPEIVSTDMTDRVSARGFTMGYVGSILLLVFSLILIQGHNTFGFSDESAAVRFVFLLVGIWWIAFAQIPLRILPDSKSNGAASQTILLNGYRELRSVWKRLNHLPQLKTYLLAYFFFNMGVQTVMYLAATFGSKELQLPGPKLIATVLLIQLVGAAGAFLFARLSGKIGNKRTLTILISVWIVICFIAYFINQELEFYAVAFLVGIVMGGIQSLSRATYSKLIPADTHDYASFFSFYDVVFNISIVMGTFTYGFIEHLTGSMRNSTLVLMIFFVLGLIFLRKVKMSSPPPAMN
jgi:UMF1 family MFS transporter